MASETEWIFDGCPRYSEFREEVGTDDDEGAVLYQAVQRRTVYQFKRYKYYCQESGQVYLNSTTTQLGEDSIGAEINAKQGALTINANIVLMNAKWICMTDDIETTELGLHAYKRVQVWEKRDDWEDYAWPQAPTT